LFWFFQTASAHGDNESHFEYCLPLIVTSDANSDGFLDRDNEFLNFVNAYGMAEFPDCYVFATTLPSLIKTLYGVLSCKNCSSTEALVSVDGATLSESERTLQQTEQLKSLCANVHPFLLPNEEECDHEDEHDEAELDVFQLNTTEATDQQLEQCILNLEELDVDKDSGLTREEFYSMLPESHNCSDHEKLVRTYEHTYDQLLASQCPMDAAFFNCLRQSNRTISIKRTTSSTPSGGDTSHLRYLCESIVPLRSLPCSVDENVPIPPKLPNIQNDTDGISSDALTEAPSYRPSSQPIGIHNDAAKSTVSCFLTVAMTMWLTWVISL